MELGYKKATLDDIPVSVKASTHAYTGWIEEFMASGDPVREVDMKDVKQKAGTVVGGLRRAAEALGHKEKLAFTKRLDRIWVNKKTKKV